MYSSQIEEIPMMECPGRDCLSVEENRRSCGAWWTEHSRVSARVELRRPPKRLQRLNTKCDYNCKHWSERGTSGMKQAGWGDFHLGDKDKW
jgi:hypothetical protein